MQNEANNISCTELLERLNETIYVIPCNTCSLLCLILFSSQNGYLFSFNQNLFFSLIVGKIFLFSVKGVSGRWRYFRSLRYSNKSLSVYSDDPSLVPRVSSRIYSGIYLRITGSETTHFLWEWLFRTLEPLLFVPPPSLLLCLPMGWMEPLSGFLYARIYLIWGNIQCPIHFAIFCIWNGEAEGGSLLTYWLLTLVMSISEVPNSVDFSAWHSDFHEAAEFTWTHHSLVKWPWEIF